MEEGGELTAHVRNIPPTIGGDLDLTVSKGRSVRITLADLNALDPDDKPEDLTFEISNAAGGFVALATTPKLPVSSSRRPTSRAAASISLTTAPKPSTAQFDVTVTDLSGATSGALQNRQRRRPAWRRISATRHRHSVVIAYVGQDRVWNGGRPLY